MVHEHHSWVRLLVDCFLPLVACMVPYGTMKISPQGESFQLSSDWTPGPFLKCSVFNNRGLNTNYLGQPKAVAVACNVLGVPCTILTSNSRELLIPGIIFFFLYYGLTCGGIIVIPDEKMLKYSSL